MLLDTGMCAGVSVPVATMLGSPSKVLDKTLMPWHEPQLVVIPLWLNDPLAKLAKLVVVLLATWQLSQPRLAMGTWLGDGVMMGCAVVVLAYNAALATLWHCAQLVVLDWKLA
jgi:hypothetical protein